MGSLVLNAWTLSLPKSITAFVAKARATTIPPFMAVDKVEKPLIPDFEASSKPFDRFLRLFWEERIPFLV